jgi:hypothetical protein
MRLIIFVSARALLGPSRLRALGIITYADLLNFWVVRADHSLVSLGENFSGHK